MDDQNPAIETTVMLIRIANIISPLHAKAVSEHLAQYTEPGCKCSECADTFAEIIQSIITSLDDLAWAAENNGGAVAIQPMSQEYIVSRDDFLIAEMGELVIRMGQFLPKPKE